MKVLDMHCDTITRLYEEYPNESLLENTGPVSYTHLTLPTIA